MLGPTGLKKKKGKKTGNGLGTVLLTYVFTQLWFMISGVVFSCIEL